MLALGGLALDTAAHTVTVDGARLELTFKEFELLRLFLSRPGVAFTREQLFAQVWGEDYQGGDPGKPQREGRDPGGAGHRGGLRLPGVRHPDAPHGLLRPASR